MVAKNPAPTLTTKAMTSSQTMGVRYLLTNCIMIDPVYGRVQVQRKRHVREGTLEKARWKRHVGKGAVGQDISRKE